MTISSQIYKMYEWMKMKLPSLGDHIIRRAIGINYNDRYIIVISEMTVMTMITMKVIEV